MYFIMFELYSTKANYSSFIELHLANVWVNKGLVCNYISFIACVSHNASVNTSLKHIYKLGGSVVLPLEFFNKSIH